MRYCLEPLSLLYKAGAAFSCALYRWNIRRARVAPQPVISVGNISFGGSGKTPLVSTLIERFLSWGRRPALVSRGYRGRWEKTGGVLSDGKAILAGWREAGDEPLMIALRHPSAGVFVGRDRLAGCRRATELGFDVVILDDGFQHHRLARDLDIVLFQPEAPGPRREFESALGRSHMILVPFDTPEPLKQTLGARHPGPVQLEYEVKPLGLFSLREGLPIDPPLLPGQTRALVISGIARPKRFLNSLAGLGVRVEEHIAFPDHHDYPPASLTRIEERAAALGADLILMTEKDAVKLRGRLNPDAPPGCFLKIGLKLPVEFDMRVRNVPAIRGNSVE